MKLLYAKIIFLLSMFFVTSNTFSQVTLGSLIPPSKGATLQIKSSDPDSNNGQTALDKGFLLPRVNLVSTRSLEPAVPSSATDYNAQKMLHTGMMVFNLTENTSGGLQKGVYIWSGDEWQYMLTESKDLSLDVTPLEIIIGSGIGTQTIDDTEVIVTWFPADIDCVMEKKTLLMEELQLLLCLFLHKNHFREEVLQLIFQQQMLHLCNKVTLIKILF